jgi:hypothetical protein
MVVNKKVTSFVHIKSTKFATRDGAAAARLAHNQEVLGSSPSPATKYLMQSHRQARLRQLLIKLLLSQRLLLQKQSLRKLNSFYNVLKSSLHVELFN